MIDIKLFEKIKDKYGAVSSWAVWSEEGETPKSNIGDIDIFDLEKNPDIFNILKTNIVMVGLNFSRTMMGPIAFKNFHDANPYANDFKIRYAFKIQIITVHI